MYFITGMSQITVTSSGMERSIHEMLKDAPSLNESDNAVHTGTPPPHVPNNCSSDSHPRPATINLSLGSPTNQTCIYQIFSCIFISEQNFRDFKIGVKRCLSFFSYDSFPKYTYSKW